MAKNEITGDSLRTKPASQNYRSNYDAIFNKGDQMQDERERTSDVIDASDYIIEAMKNDGIAEASRKAAEMPAGEAGECDGCGEFFTRIVNGYCGHCRDKFSSLIK